MFFGDERSKQKVSFRAQKSAAPSRNDFLQATQQQREERQKQRLREKSAQTIQKVWRKVRSNRSFDELERKKWDKEISESSTLEGLEQMYRPILSLSFFYSKEKDAQRFDLLCEKLTAIYEKHTADVQKEKSNRKVLVFKSKEEALKWSFLFGKLLDISSHRLSHNLQVHVKFLLFFTNPEVFGFEFEGENSVENSKLYKKKCNEMMFAPLGNGELLSSIRKVIIQFSSNNSFLQLLITIALKSLQYPSKHKNGKGVSYQFVYEILSIPNLPQKFTVQVQIMLANLSNILFNFDPQQNLPNETSINWGKRSRTDMEIDDEKVNEMNPVDIELTRNDWILSNVFSITQHLIKSNPDARTVNMMTSSIQFLDKLMRVCNTRKYFVKNADASFLEPLRNFITTPKIKAILSLFPVQSTVKTDEKTIANSLPIGFIHFCSIIIHFQANWEEQKTPLLNSISFGTPITRRLWLGIQGTVELAQIAYDGKGISQELPPLLLMFAKTFSHLLFTMDDDEFFQQTVFTIPELVSMISTLKTVAYRMFFDDRNDELRDNIVNLLQQLYDRNARKAFCPETNWLVEESRNMNVDSVLGVRSVEQDVLKNIPFVVPFDLRIAAFYNAIDEERERSQHNYYDTERVRIRRDYIFEDAFSKLNQLDSRLKKRIQVELIGETGMAEAGVDGGGVFKEFLTQLLKTAYNTEYGLFKETHSRALYPNPASAMVVADDSEQFEFLGKILGKAIFERILVNIPFANFFIAKLLGKINFISDLYSLDPVLHKNLSYLKSADVDDLSLTFTLTDNDFGQNEQVELVRNGKDIAVTNENKHRYIAYVANHKLNTQIKRQSAAFLRGFGMIISPELLRMFSQEEVHRIICGNPGRIDIEDMKRYAVYSGGYHAEHPSILMFWSMLEKFSVEEQQQFLMFVTSCSRPPLMGFKSVHPPFCIHRSVPAGVYRPEELDTYLPTASTCMNFLKMPAYSNEQAMTEKFLYAISSKSGFELS